MFTKSYFVVTIYTLKHLIKMEGFKKQILEDIEEYQNHYPMIEHIEKNEWAFNFWILDKLFSEEEETIEEHIVDYNDKGIDCFVWHEEQRDLYLIQNKFYDEKTKLSVDYVLNDFLTRAIGALEKESYVRSELLQNIYNKYHGDPEFSIHFQLYITNNSCKTPELMKKIREYNSIYSRKRYDAQLYSLDDIQQLYFKGAKEDTKTFNYIISTINKGTILRIDNSAYELTLAADARYVLTPITVVYSMLKSAKKEGYSLFNDNIRDYLGSTGTINKKIVETLKNAEERKNFFFYNNGITMIVDDMGTDYTVKDKRQFSVKNPQIVNGCQTVNTIFETLYSWPESKVDSDFVNTYVMIKILKIPKGDMALKELYKNIVTYNNSQNSIDDKTFVANTNVFKRVQREFRDKGFLICIKQSDKFQFKKEYSKPTKLLDNSHVYLEKFGLNFTKTVDFIIDLEKLLQIFLSFISKPSDAVQNKSKLLKVDSSQNKQIIDFIQNENLTINDMICLMLLYRRAELQKRLSLNGKSPNAFYVIYWFSKYECKGDIRNISLNLCSQEKIDEIVRRYSQVFNVYYNMWSRANADKDYNSMIKSPIDLDKEEDAIAAVSFV